MAVGFFGGRAYLLTPTDFPGLSHHAKLHVAYMRMLLHVEACFGQHLPDVALILTTSDTPRYVSPRVVNASSPPPRVPPLHRAGQPFEPGPYPIAGIGKSDFYPDLLLVPNFHFHMKLYDNTSLASIPAFDESTPWEERKNVLFGRFSQYRTNRNQADPDTLKAGRGGKGICYDENKICPVREHFIKELADKDKARMDVTFRRRVTMQKHTEYKYLVNLDGQGISSRLEQLLPLGSVVFKQQSGYYAYYYRTISSRLEQLLPLGSAVFKQQSGYYAYYYRTCCGRGCGTSPAPGPLLPGFLAALQLIADKKKCSMDALCNKLADADPMASVTKAEFVRHHDDKTTYTGVYRAGGPRTLAGAK
ncbi:hypothetical protein TSOC_009222 [Tetrabaena socialis]|uniref:Glycosyl transferase CAP10 domain-containing protein n=1 Tax=Tetrabaena socialis TaxID=47790 RepID=A0A2J7ZWC9_9CHLO|nr:hypothetical protein TSOC_009222 [Tetrabaena socialis]|eukprot:PNH04583.1 hypothetical protein TSOC_009222 [Tetrabaena socialis]